MVSVLQYLFNVDALTLTGSSSSKVLQPLALQFLPLFSFSTGPPPLGNLPHVNVRSLLPVYVQMVCTSLAAARARSPSRTAGPS
jgi:hypothetical protein